MVNRRLQAAYDALATRYALVNAAMPPALAASAAGFLQLLGAHARILDVGCGAGRDMAWLEARGALVVGMDISLGMLARARSATSGALLQMDMRCLGLWRAQFQGVWCCASLVHLPKVQAPLALAEMRRVLVPGGVLFLSVQGGTGEAWEVCPYAQVERLFVRYTDTEVVDLLTQAGFDVLEAVANEAASRHWLQFLATPKTGTE